MYLNKQVTTERYRWAICRKLMCNFDSNKDHEYWVSYKAFNGPTLSWKLVTRIIFSLCIVLFIVSVTFFTVRENSFIYYFFMVKSIKTFRTSNRVIRDRTLVILPIKKMNIIKESQVHLDDHCISVRVCIEHIWIG